MGVVPGFVSVMLAYIIGAFVAVFILLPFPHYLRALTRWGILRGTSARGFTMKSEVPFGPFLAAGIILVWLSLLYGIYDPVMSYLGY